ncbi:MAG TPA: xanthine dehydrogenase family protein subunit M [Trinickia sp.]|jgi:CO/xanthine dehydrogenase FAD-binding subunit|uniref:FAD binding domain-containing protein n=1 Tax=Trinickia sp. TaxID=2571163 RepID=UPI002C80C5B9|nr:xanthine dehydrogenase family protein subunit M [Trinickia sp.]HTI17229.1 xanthine dehydrogenase family protein subunit M [Trinickia sp.]
MKPAAFSYHRPQSLDTALALLAEFGYDAKVIAGGQSLGPMMNMRLARPMHVVDLAGLPDLTGIERGPDALRIGAMTRHHDVATSADVRAACPLLSEAVSTVGHYAIRQRGTLGGSLANADPAAQIPLIVRTLGAWIDVAGPAGQREIAASDFVVAPMTTTLEPEEIITAVRFPCLRATEGYGFELFTRRHGDFAIGACAATAVVEAGCFTHLRIGVGGVDDVPVGFEEICAKFIGEAADTTTIDRIAAQVTASIAVRDQAGVSAEYRRELVHVLTARALARACRHRS